VTPPSPYVISYFTRDLAACRLFYEGLVGLAVHTEVPDVYFLCGAGPWRLQFPRIDPDRLGRDTVSSGLVLFGVETENEFADLQDRLRSATTVYDDGCRDPDGRVVMVQVFDPAAPFHD